MGVNNAMGGVNSLSHHYNTPQKYMNVINKFFNTIELDPCSNEHSKVNAINEICLPDDGLSIDWKLYSTIFINPPYGRDKERNTTIKNWIKKASETYLDNPNVEIIMLIPVATNTEHFKKYVFPVANNICFLSDSRVKFGINGSEENKGSPMACCLVYFGLRSTEFFNTFSVLGNVISLKSNN